MQMCRTYSPTIIHELNNTYVHPGYSSNSGKSFPLNALMNTQAWFGWVIAMDLHDHFGSDEVTSYV
jgi:hypothetical protein